jgi:ankyrin repeat protein
MISILTLLLSIPPTLAFAQEPPSARKELERSGIPFSPEEFIQRVEAGDFEIVRMFLDAGMNVDSRNSRGWTALMVAAGKGYVDIARLIIARGAAVNAEGGGLTSLRLAAFDGHAAIVKLLLEKGANVNAKGFIDETALSMSIPFQGREPNPEVINLLLDVGADVNAKTRDGGFPLLSAAMAGYSDVVEALVKHGADVNERSRHEEEEEGLTSLMMAAWAAHLETAKMLLKYGADADLRDANGDTAAAAAAQGGYPETALLLKQAMKNPEESGLNDLMWAAVVGDEAKVRSLLTQGVDVNAQGASRRTALHYAVSNRRREIVALLLDSMADVNAADAAGETPLLTAVWKNDLDLVKLIISRGGQVNAKDACDITALDRGLLIGRVEAAEILLNHGALVNTGKQLDTYYMPANSLQLLLNRGIKMDVNVPDDRGWTPLFRAVFGQEIERVRVLLDAGADVNIRDRRGETPLSIAQKSGNAEIVQLLKAAGAKEEK